MIFGRHGHRAWVPALLLIALVARAGGAQSRAAICAGATVLDSTGVVAGVVRDARTRAPIAGSVVSAEWLELTVNRAGYARSIARVADTTGENGLFTLCDVPSPGTIFLLANRGADSTDLIEANVPAVGALRRDLYIGAARSVEVRDAAGRADPAESPRRMRVGDGRLSGTVVAETGSERLAGARVRIADGPEARADEQGEWVLAGIPSGTRMLEVRAVGHYPRQVAVDVLENGPPISTALSTMGSVLDTVRITASRLGSRSVSGFAERRHAGLGRYLTREQIARRNPINIADMFHMVPGVRAERQGLDTRITMRSMYGGNRCSPALYLDGQHLRGLSVDDINSWVSPDEVAGVEIYAAGMIPPQFDPGMSGCGSIVVWTGARSRARDPRSFSRRLFTVVGAITLGVVVGAAIQ